MANGNMGSRIFACSVVHLEGASNVGDLHRRLAVEHLTNLRRHDLGLSEFTRQIGFGELKYVCIL